jgi:rRNA maturation RNase YbeY
MILFFSETNFKLSKKIPVKNWLACIANNENKKIKVLNIVFYSDEQLFSLNKKYLNHYSLTDIITFDFSEKNLIQGDICISVERVKDNAEKFYCSFEEELRRVMVHGLLHLCGYKDKKSVEKKLMKQKEDEALFIFNTQYNYMKDKLL